MFVTDEIYPPAQYAWGWLVLAFGVILLGILVATLVLWFTRQRTTIDADDAPPVPLATSEMLARLRTEYADAIDHIEHSYRDGNMTPREANLALSATVRRYVNEYSGLEAPVLALDEPTFGQDRRTWEELLRLLADIADDGTAVVAITHDAEFVDVLADERIELS